MKKRVSLSPYLPLTLNCAPMVGGFGAVTATLLFLDSLPYQKKKVLKSHHSTRFNYVEMKVVSFFSCQGHDIAR